MFFALLLLVSGRVPAQDILRNPFNDPMLQITNELAGCPTPEEPTYTREQFAERAHDRAQRGVSCWLAGRCRLPNSYLYDAEIIPRVKRAIDARNGFENTSVWALGERRLVTLRGCVQNESQAKELESIVKHLDDVEGVRNELMVGTGGTPPYAVRKRDGVKAGITKIR